MSEIKLHSVYPVTSRFLPEALTCHDYAKLPCILREQEETLEGMPFLVELSEFELHIHHLKENPASVPNHVEKWQVRPGLELLELSWSGLPEFIEGGQVVPWREKCLVVLVPGEEK